MTKSKDELNAEGERLLREGLPTEMGQATNSIHEVYGELKEAGFTRFEALWIVGYVMSCAGAVPNDEA